MKYKEARGWLDSFVNYEKQNSFSYKNAFDLHRMKELCATFGNPQDSFKIIHIAGTKGKGSVAVMISSILKEAGLRVGLYTSPHLADFRERIQVYEKENSKIGKREIIHLVEKIKGRLEDFTKKSTPIRNTENRKPIMGFFTPLKNFSLTGRTGLTFFEIYTLLAFLYFQERRVDFSILETGLGGRLDATNVAKPLISVITSLSLEHTDKLGKHIKDIAREKGGIIKKGSSVVSAPQKREALKVIKGISKQKKSSFYLVGKDILPSSIRHIKGVSKQIFDIKGISGEYKKISLPLLGRHQVVNAAVAIGTVEVLKNYNISISPSSIKRGLEKVIWPGRLEIIQRKPLIILDGAQNEESSRKLKQAIREYFNYQRLILVLGISRDKDIKGICRNLLLLADEVILTKADNPRATEPEEISRQLPIRSRQEKPIITQDVKEALKIAKEKAGKRDLILTTGSLFVVGEARRQTLNGKE